MFWGGFYDKGGYFGFDWGPPPPLPIFGSIDYLNSCISGGISVVGITLIQNIGGRIAANRGEGGQASDAQ